MLKYLYSFIYSEPEVPPIEPTEKERAQKFLSCEQIKKSQMKLKSNSDQMLLNKRDSVVPNRLTMKEKRILHRRHREDLIKSSNIL